MRWAKLSVVGLGFLIAGCSEDARSKAMFGMVTDVDTIAHDGHVYTVAFQPSGQFVNETPEGELLAVGVGVGWNARLEVRRDEKTPFQRSEIETARGVAFVACEKNPQWRRDAKWGPGLEFGGEFVAFSGICN